MSEPSPGDEPIDGIIDTALTEDAANDDITSRSLIPADMVGRASLLVKEAGVLAGIDIAGRVFRKIDPSLKVEVLVKDGAAVKPGDVAAVVRGSVLNILKAERVALNFLQRLSGIATLTAQYVAATKDTRADIYDTRKTTPGLRGLEKYAVRVGGGYNHRRNLADAVLIKDNHLAALRATGLKLPEIVARARVNTPKGTTIEVEVTNREEAKSALKASADIIMLDNMKPEEMRPIVKMVAGRARLEASGGITLENVGAVAATGVDMISVGALTHSYRALDISLELEPQTLKLI